MSETLEQPIVDFMEISRDLEIHHSVFYQLWEMGEPIFTDTIDTACVIFDQVGKNIGFMWNPKFYKKLNRYERKFVICHECLHVILNHGYRSKGIEKQFTNIANVAMDVVINELLVKRFGFDREKISNWKDLCWLDTVFKDRKDIEPDQTFEYYYRALKKDIKFINLPFTLVDDHSGLANSNWEEVIDQMNKDLTDEEKESLKETINRHFQEEKEKENSLRGNEAGGQWTFAKVKNVAKKKKWETVIKKWAMKFTSDFINQEQWARVNRRNVLLPDELLLPSEMEEEEMVEPNKIEVWFFQDTSGSCSGFKDRFFTAALTLPPWRFDVKMHCFDTKVYETTLESRKLYGFGGTKFDILETYIQNYCQEHDKKYPEAVFVVTDGFGTHVRPQNPGKWFWFLSTKYTKCIPNECNIFNLADFE